MSYFWTAILWFFAITCVAATGTVTAFYPNMSLIIAAAIINLIGVFVIVPAAIKADKYDAMMKGRL